MGFYCRVIAITQPFRVLLVLGHVDLLITDPLIVGFILTQIVRD